MNTGEPNRYWKAFLLAEVAILALLVIAVYWDPIRDIVKIGLRDTDRAYVFIVPVIAGYLAWLRRSRIAALTLRGRWWGPVIIFVGWCCFVTGAYFDVVAMWHFGIISAIIGGLVSFGGLQIIWYFGPPLLILLAVIPIPGSVRQALAQPLQGFATFVTALVLDFFGVPAIRSGNVIQINGNAVAVGEACNGMRLLIPLGLVIFAFVFSLPLKLRFRMLLLLISIPVALVCNVFRLVPSALAYGYLPEFAEMVHDIGGWLMIPLSIGILLLMLRLVEWLDISVSRWRLMTG